MEFYKVKLEWKGPQALLQFAIVMLTLRLFTTNKLYFTLGGCKTVRKTFVGSLSHELPASALEVPVTLDYLPVQLLDVLSYLEIVKIRFNWPSFLEDISHFCGAPDTPV